MHTLARQGELAGFARLAVAHMLIAVHQGLQGSGAISPSLIQIGTMRASSVMRPITAGLCR